jgi:hypothetical protein
MMVAKLRLEPDDFAPAARGFNPDLARSRLDRGCGWTWKRLTYMVVFVKIADVWWRAGPIIANVAKQSSADFWIAAALRTSQ